jgi:hypothetical protein
MPHSGTLCTHCFFTCINPSFMPSRVRETLQASARKLGLRLGLGPRCLAQSALQATSRAPHDLVRILGSIDIVLDPRDRRWRDTSRCTFLHTREITLSQMYEGAGLDSRLTSSNSPVRSATQLTSSVPRPGAQTPKSTPKFQTHRK